jgi:hypothetical protein
MTVILSNINVRVIKFPARCKREFASVDILLQSNCKTKTVDALILSLAKYEKQLRKLLCFLLFQNPAITNTNFGNFNKVIINKKNLFPDNTIKAINDLQVGTVSAWVGEQFEPLTKQLNTINTRRNKLIHGQITGENLNALNLTEDISTILKWVNLLARGSKRTVGYDGLGRNTFRLAKKIQAPLERKYPFLTPQELKIWLDKFKHSTKQTKQ